MKVGLNSKTTENNSFAWSLTPNVAANLHYWGITILEDQKSTADGVINLADQQVQQPIMP